MANVGFIGLGVMGSRMAGHLITKGHDVTVWNRTASRAEPLREKGAKVAQTVRQLADSCDFVCICVSKSEDVLEVVSQFPESMQGKIVIDHSTIAPKVAREIGSRLNCAFIDAPVTGGERGAIEGTLTIFCGGNTNDFNKAKPIMEAYGAKVRLVGPQGSGQLMKMANQIAVGIGVLALCESMAFAEKAGLDLTETLELLGSGAAGSWAFANYGPKILERNWTPGFSVALQLKDLRYALDAGRASGASLPGTEMVAGLLAEMERAGMGQDATPALFKALGGV
jgi:3-hydroxyisobutyrate dehydrogenase-like beta-hydroxyacid dehydrogenase